MKKSLAVVATAVAIIGAGYLLWPNTAAQVLPDPVPAVSTTTPQFPLAQYLKSKKSPLVPDAEYLLTQKHWRLLVAISAIESQYCKRLIAYNCFGVGGDSAYRHYASYRESVIDAEALIEKWQAKGKWLTIDSMNCSYVVPCNDNWVRVVKKVYGELNFENGTQ
jgi:hypothetical protein